MNQNYFCIEQEDGYLTKVFHYPSKGATMANLVIFHGMAEHHTRYEYFADFMTDLGFSLYLFDHRGHGTDKRIDELGYFHSKKGYLKVIHDALKVVDFVKEQEPSEKLFLMGHSMGSLILRNVLQYNDTIDGAIICGTTYPDSFTLRAGLLVSSAISVFQGHTPSTFLNNLLFGGKIYTKYCNRTAYDWLTRDMRIVSNYIHDPYCGFICTASFYHDLIKLTTLAATKKLMLKTRKNLPLLIISGDQDPVGGNGEEVQKLYNFYTSANYSNVKLTLYPNCRHEVLNELNKDEIISDISAWITSQMTIS